MSEMLTQDSIKNYNKKIYIRLGEHIKRLIEEVSIRLKHFLQLLINTYEKYGIIFDVQQNFANLMRILTPFQLLSQYQIVQNKELVSKQLMNKIISNVEQQEDDDEEEITSMNINQNVMQYKMNNLFNYYPKQQNSDYVENMPKSSALQMLKNLREETEKKQMQKLYEMSDRIEELHKQKQEKQKKIKQKHQLKIKQNANPTLQDRIKMDANAFDYRKMGIVGKKKQNVSVIQNNRNYYARDSIYNEGPKKSLPKNLERQLFNWATERLRSGKALMHRDIVAKALQFGKRVPNLVVSYGWAQKFIQRYPSLYVLYRKSKKEDRKTESRFTYSQQIQPNTQKTYNTLPQNPVVQQENFEQSEMSENNELQSEQQSEQQSKQQQQKPVSIIENS